MTEQLDRNRRIAPAAAQEDSRRAIGRVLFGICLAVMSLHILSVAIRSAVGPKAGALDDVLALLNAAQERSLAGWWTSALLLTCCVTALTASRLAGTTPPPSSTPSTARGSSPSYASPGSAARGTAAWPWVVLAVIFALLSLDEVVSLHERGARWTSAVLDSSSPLARLGWTIPAAAILLLSLLVLIPAFRAIPPRARTFVLAGLGTSVAGAMGMELVNVALTQAGARYLWRHVAMAIEESAEMAGVVIVLLGVLTVVRIGWAGHQLSVSYSAGDARSE